MVQFICMLLLCAAAFSAAEKPMSLQDILLRDLTNRILNKETKTQSDDDDCFCEALSTGEIICDPYGCGAIEEAKAATECLCINHEGQEYCTGNCNSVEEAQDHEAIAMNTGGGANYIRWGKTTCPTTPGTQSIYKGVAAGSHYAQNGGGAEYLCLTEDPQYPYPPSAATYSSFLYGVEYHTYGLSALGQLTDQDAPCVACVTTARASKIMIPGTDKCPASWTLEYNGYLVSASYQHFRTSYECLDKEAEGIPGSSLNIDGALFVHVKATCSGLPCPPYQTGYDMSCVVCTM